MRIACDARPLLGQRTGVSVWLEGLVRGLAAATDWDFVLCLPRPISGVGVDDLAGRAQTSSPPVRMPGTLWLHTLASPLVNDDADVYLGTLGVLPRRLRMPAALVVHDLTPRTRPHRHTLANRFCFNAYIEESVERADALVCDSKATAAVLGAIWPRHGRRAVVVPPGIDEHFSPAADGESPEPVRLRFAAGRSFIVQLGTLEPRKGVATLLGAHGVLLRRRPETPDLVLAGKAGWGGNWLEAALVEHPDRDRVHVVGYVTRDEARALLRHAEAVAVSSEEEGFGLPLAEALACGAACVASDDPALVEVAGGAALHFVRGDRDALVAALERVLTPDVRDVLRDAARTRAPHFAWGRSLESWRALLQGLADARG
ncbi:MAG: glycosyltransferase family 4 protein [Acidobacteriota bacterium]